MMKVSRITEDTIRDTVQAKTKKKMYITEVNGNGFAVRITPKGFAVFVHRSKINGNTKDFTIASCLETTPASARKMNLQLKNDLAQSRKGSVRTLKSAMLELIFNYSLRYGAALPDVINIETVHKHFEDEHPKKVVAAFRRMLRHYPEGIKLHQISSQMVQNYYAERVKTSVSLANKEIGYLKHLFNIEKLQNHITHNPTNTIKLKKLSRKNRSIAPEYLPNFQLLLSDWLSQKPTTYSNQSATVAIRFAFETGLRTKELLSLSFQDEGDNNFVDLKNSIIHLRSWKNAKPGMVRYVPMSNVAKVLISNYANVHKCTYAFPNNKLSRNVHVSICREAFNYARNMSNLAPHLKKVITLYSTRHTAANLMLNKHNLSRHEVSEILGHSDPKTLKIYEGDLLERFKRYSIKLSVES